MNVPWNQFFNQDGTVKPVEQLRGILQKAGVSADQEVICYCTGGVRSAAGQRAIDEMDLRMRDSSNTANPGTTADLTAAAIFVVLLGGGWHAAHGNA